jgi:hypothetical protein
MGMFGDRDNKEKKKMKKSLLEKKAQKQLSGGSWQPPQVEIIKRGKKEW